MDFEAFKAKLEEAVTRAGKDKLGLEPDSFCPLGCMTLDLVDVFPRPTPYMCMLYLGLDVLVAASFTNGYDGSLHRYDDEYLPYFELGRQYRQDVICKSNLILSFDASLPNSPTPAR